MRTGGRHRRSTSALNTGVTRRILTVVNKGRDRFREQASFRTYLFAIAHNILCDQLRGQRRATAELDLERLSVVDLGASPHSLLAARGEERLLLHALRQVPFATQVILELYYWEHLTGAELGVFLGVPEETARSRLRKARQVLEQTVRRIETDHHRLESTVSNLDMGRARTRPARADALTPAAVRQLARVDALVGVVAGGRRRVGSRCVLAHAPADRAQQTGRRVRRRNAG